MDFKTYPYDDITISIQSFVSNCVIQRIISSSINSSGGSVVKHVQVS